MTTKVQQKKIATWCKICGVTNLEDAIAGQAAGADALGFNCFPGSARYITPEMVSTLSQSIETTRVGLFVNACADDVEAVLAVAELDMLQFHGDESPTFCSSFGLPYIRALRMRPDLDIEYCAEQYAAAWGLLLDTYVPHSPGGTGQSFDWQRWPTGLPVRLILAGGLTPDTVAGAIEQLTPFGVDVCGGVEGPEKRTKDKEKMTRFLQEVRNVRHVARQ